MKVLTASANVSFPAISRISSVSMKVTSYLLFFTDSEENDWTAATLLTA